MNVENMRHAIGDLIKVGIGGGISLTLQEALPPGVDLGLRTFAAGVVGVLYYSAHNPLSSEGANRVVPEIVGSVLVAADSLAAYLVIHAPIGDTLKLYTGVAMTLVNTAMLYGAEQLEDIRRGTSGGAMN